MVLTRAVRICNQCKDLPTISTVHLLLSLRDYCPVLVCQINHFGVESSWVEIVCQYLILKTFQQDHIQWLATVGQTFLGSHPPKMIGWQCFLCFLQLLDRNIPWQMVLVSCILSLVYAWILVLISGMYAYIFRCLCALTSYIPRLPLEAEAELPPFRRRFRLRFHWNLFLRLELKHFSISSENGLALTRRQAII